MYDWDEMSVAEMVERTERALRRFSSLPAEEQIKRMVARGTINENGEVLMGGKTEREDQE